MAERDLPGGRAAVTELADKIVVASVSGGKDSAALSLWLSEQGIEHRRVFADTGWEHPATLEYVREVLPTHLGPIDWVSGALQMTDLIRKKGMFPSRLRRFCTEDLKVRPIMRYIDALDGDVVNALGIRAAESAARAKLEEWEWATHFDCWTWRPLLRWTEAEVIEMHRKHGLPPNPLYLKGASRVGCWPCIYARKGEIRLVAELSPERIDEIRALEEEVTAGAVARAGGPRARGAADSPGYYGTTRAFFAGRTTRDGVEPIDSVIEWATRGSEQEEMFPEQNDGCMRWGLCETED
jgi:3'-phosphoadenosine 5'-phosphosulfate sulfotransferase (PAPS reductase)/FAD synthetase